MKRIALLLTVALFATSLTGCSCCRRIRGTICPGAYCGSRAPVLGAARAPAPVAAPVVAAPVVAPPPVVAAPPQVVQPPQVVTVPQYVQPRVIQPQVVAPACVPCCPPCPCPCPCPTVVCDPCCDPCCNPCDPCCGGCNSGCCHGGSSYAGSGSDCNCNAPYGIQVRPGEYLGEVETNDSWEGSGEPTEAGRDPGPAN